MRPVSKGLKVLSIIFLCIVIVVTAGIGLLLYRQVTHTPPEEVKKAFILLPGLMGSSLCDPQYENAVVWSADTSWLASQTETDPAFCGNYAADFLAYDDSSVPIKTLVAASASTVRADGYDLDRYGFGGLTSLLSAYLSEQYADIGYEVITWQYDWRVTTQQSADLLESFINAEGYTNISILAYDTGGNVAARYLRKPENRSKVNLFMPFGTPFFGSLDKLDWLFTIGEEAVRENPYGIYQDLIHTLGISSDLSDLPATALLFPYAAMSYLSAYHKDEGPILLNDEKVTFNELYDYFCSQNFAKTDSLALKSVYENLVEYQHEDFIEIKGKLKHVTEFVNTVFVVGTGVRTRYSASINTASGIITSFMTDLNGDGSVWAYSATAGRSLNADNVIMVNAEEVAFSGHDNFFDNAAVLEMVKAAIDAHVVRD